LGMEAAISRKQSGGALSWVSSTHWCLGMGVLTIINGLLNHMLTWQLMVPGGSVLRHLWTRSKIAAFAPLPLLLTAAEPQDPWSLSFLIGTRK
jgi:hypothetical protein